jgi:hypothetical protein
MAEFLELMIKLQLDVDWCCHSMLLPNPFSSSSLQQFLALLEAKLLLFSILTKFKIEKCSKTPEKLTFTKGNIGMNEKIYEKVKTRKFFEFIFNKMNSIP